MAHHQQADSLGESLLVKRLLVENASLRATNAALGARVRVLVPEGSSKPDEMSGADVVAAAAAAAEKRSKLSREEIGSVARLKEADVAAHAVWTQLAGIKDGLQIASGAADTALSDASPLPTGAAGAEDESASSQSSDDDGEEGADAAKQQQVPVSWSTADWIRSIGSSIGPLMAKALLRPLNEQLRAHKRCDPTGDCELTYVRELGRAAEDDDKGVAELFALLRHGDVLQSIAEVLWAGVKQLVAEHDDALSFVGKFSSPGETLTYGALSTFFGGLDGLLGPPNPNLSGAVLFEHCEAADSNFRFTAPNYGTETTSAIEYYFVVDPAAGITKLGLKEGYPEETKLKSQKDGLKYLRKVRAACPGSTDVAAAGERARREAAYHSGALARRLSHPSPLPPLASPTPHRRSQPTHGTSELRCSTSTTASLSRMSHHSSRSEWD